MFMKTRKIVKAVMNIKKDSSKWLCDDCRKLQKKETSKGVPFAQMIMASDDYFCVECSTNIKKLLSKYKTFNNMFDKKE